MLTTTPPHCNSGGAEGAVHQNSVVMGARGGGLVGIGSIGLFNLIFCEIASLLDKKSQTLHNGQLDGALHLDTSNIARHTNSQTQVLELAPEVGLICGREALALNAAGHAAHQVASGHPDLAVDCCRRGVAPVVAESKVLLQQSILQGWSQQVSHAVWDIS